MSKLFFNLIRDLCLTLYKITFRVDHIINKNIHTPPSYNSVGAEAVQPAEDTETPASPGSPHRVTTFQNDGQVKETTVERIRGVKPHSPNMSPPSLQRQNRVHSSENSAPLTALSNKGPVFMQNNSISQELTESENEDEFADDFQIPNTSLGSFPREYSPCYQIQTPTLPDQDNDDDIFDTEMQRPLTKHVASAQHAHNIPLSSNSSRTKNENLPTLPLSSASSAEDIPNYNNNDSLNRSINV